jgi:hypothetical protein
MSRKAAPRAQCRVCHKTLSLTSTKIGCTHCRECRIAEDAAKRKPHPCVDCGVEMGTTRHGCLRCAGCASNHRGATPVRPCVEPGCDGHVYAGEGKNTQRCKVCRDRRRAEGLTKVRSVITDPLGCSGCAGLPWRRGNERPGAICRTCGEPWEPEEMPTLMDWSRSGLMAGGEL